MEDAIRQFLEVDRPESSFGRGLFDSIMVVNSSSTIVTATGEQSLGFPKACAQQGFEGESTVSLDHHFLNHLSRNTPSSPCKNV